MSQIFRDGSNDPRQGLIGLLTLVALVCCSASGLAQFRESENEKGPVLGESRTQRWRAGVTVKAVGGPCQGIVASIPVPVDWPEQTVIISDEEVSPQAKVNQGRNTKSVPQMVIQIRLLPSGQEAKVILTYEVTRRVQKPPENPEIYKIAKDEDIPRDVRTYLRPSLPLVNSRDDRVRKLAGILMASKPTDWERIEAMFDYVREKIELVEGQRKGSIEALMEHKGNHEDLCFAFIAICRAANIPARTVWVERHCYPEFYMHDDEGVGHWFPCQVAGVREFGGLNDHRPIFQKGDDFPDPKDRRKRVPLLPEHLKGAGGRPSVRFIREMLPE